MSNTSVIRARVDDNIKAKAVVVLDSMGLSTSDAIRILFTRIAEEKTFPLELIPNALTPQKRRSKYTLEQLINETQEGLQRVDNWESMPKVGHELWIK